MQTTRKATATRRGTCAYIPPLSHNTGVLDMPETQSQKSPLPKRSSGLFCLKSDDNIMPILCLLCNNLCNSGKYTWLVIVLVSSLQKYRPRANIKNDWKFRNGAHQDSLDRSGRWRTRRFLRLRGRQLQHLEKNTSVKAKFSIEDQLLPPHVYLRLANWVEA